VLGGRYELGSVLGQGGIGHVYAGQDLRLGRPVAVKLLRPEVAADPATCRRFEREARIVARLSHPHIVTIYDTGEDEVPFIVTELLPGRTLADEIADGPLEGGRLRQVASEVLAALGAAHGRGVVHRDVKPGNVLIAADEHAKVADFGIAKATDDASETTGLFGTAAYLAPERLAGHTASPQSDLFSLGVVLYEAATGTKPFHADTPLATAHAIAHEQPPPLAVRRPDLDAALIGAIERAMHKDPHHRFATAAQMATAIGATHASVASSDDDTIGIGDDQPTAMLPPVLKPDRRPAGAPTPTGSRARRARVASVAAFLIIGGVLIAGWAASRDSNHATTPPTTHPRAVVTTIATVPTTTPTTTPAPPAKGNGKGKGNKGQD
jgi:serine/threonine protein kinase